MNNQNGTARQESMAQSRAGVIAYLTYALDDVGAFSQTAVHLLEMAIAVLADEAQSKNGITGAGHTKVS
jgi:hypothetical protein